MEIAGTGVRFSASAAAAPVPQQWLHSMVSMEALWGQEKGSDQEDFDRLWQPGKNLDCQFFCLLMRMMI